jgi:hypothetical protein
MKPRPSSPSKQAVHLFPGLASTGSCLKPDVTRRYAAKIDPNEHLDALLGHQISLAPSGLNVQSQ